MSMYKIHKRGVDPDGGSWAEYTDAIGRECRIEVRAGLDLEDRIQKREQDNARRRAEWAKLTPEEQERNRKEWDEIMASFEEKDGFAASYSKDPSAKGKSQLSV